MLTALGKYLRKMRIENGELLKDMATKLEMSPAMLSSIENNTRKPPSNFMERVEKAYKLTAGQIEELSKAFIESVDSVAISVKNLSTDDQELAFSFARQFSDLDYISKEEIKEILSRKK